MIKKANPDKPDIGYFLENRRQSAHQGPQIILDSDSLGRLNYRMVVGMKIFPITVPT